MAETNKKLLIVEDEELMRKTLMERFTKEGYQTVAAADGEEGLRLAWAEQPDIILLDIILPKLDGMSLMRQLRTGNDWGRQVPIILLTNLNADDNITEAVAKDKPAYYLVKTDWTLDNIVAKVRERLERVAIDAEAAAKE